MPTSPLKPTRTASNAQVAAALPNDSDRVTLAGIGQCVIGMAADGGASGCFEWRACLGEGRRAGFRARKPDRGVGKSARKAQEALRRRSTLRLPRPQLRPSGSGVRTGGLPSLAEEVADAGRGIPSPVDGVRSTDGRVDDSGRLRSRPGPSRSGGGGRRSGPGDRRPARQPQGSFARRPRSARRSRSLRRGARRCRYQILPNQILPTYPPA